MTIPPLPGGTADELLWHLNNCPVCKKARATGSNKWCARGKQLILLTIDERHGPK